MRLSKAKNQSSCSYQDDSGSYVSALYLGCKLSLHKRVLKMQLVPFWSLSGIFPFHVTRNMFFPDIRPCELMSSPLLTSRACEDKLPYRMWAKPWNPGRARDCPREQGKSLSWNSFGNWWVRAWEGIFHKHRVYCLFVNHSPSSYSFYIYLSALNAHKFHCLLFLNETIFVSWIFAYCSKYTVPLISLSPFYFL